MKTKTVIFSLEVKVPVRTGESEVENAINKALDEPPCDWGEWTVGAALITDNDGRPNQFREKEN